MEDQNSQAARECLGRKQCLFFEENLRQMPLCAEGYREQYCRGEFTRCARYRVAIRLGWDKVPMMLYPDQNQRAETLLTEFPLIRNCPA